MSSALPPRPTLRDVAHRAGVSVTTAHIALTDRREGVRVPERTRERIREVARHLGYRPNLVARSLKTSRTSTLGFVSDEVTTTPFAVAMLAAAQDEAARLGHVLLVVNTDPRDPASGARTVDVLLQQQVAGVIYASMYHKLLTPPAGLPPGAVLLNAVAAGGGPTHGQHRAVVPDDRGGARNAVAALVAAGHRRIGFLDHDDGVGGLASGLRHQGYLDALGAAGLPADLRWHARAAAAAVHGGLEVRRLVDLPAAVRPTAVFCYNDRMAMGAYRAARHLGLRIPDDLSIVGFDDQEYIAAELDPPLTTVRLPHRAMGRLAVRLLLGAPGGGLDGDEPDGEGAGVSVVPCPLVERDSVGPPATSGPAPLPVTRG